MQVIEADRIRKEYGSVVAVDDVSFSIEQGQVVGLIGPNGAGKTTLLRMLATLLRPTNGTASIFGHNLTKQYRNIRRYIGFMPDFFNLYNDLALAECLDFFARAYGIETSRIPARIDEVLDYVGLGASRANLIRNLSRGMVQRMGVAALLVHEPDLFLLDEPASGLDPRSRIQLRRVLKKLSHEGKTVIISSHILTELSGFCSHVAIMNKGRIEMFGSVEDIERKVAGAKRLTIKVLDDCARAVELLKGLSDINVMAVEADTIRAETTRTGEGIAEVNSRLVAGGVRVMSFSEEKADLEDLFMRISAEQ